MIWIRHDIEHTRQKLDIPQTARDMIQERTSAGFAAARAEGRSKRLDAAITREIAESVTTGRKSGAEMARLYNIRPPNVSRIVAQHRTAPA